MSNNLDQTRTPPAGPPPSSAGRSQNLTMPDATSPAGRVPRTRTGAAWSGICVAALLFVVLIVFMLQNTRHVEVTFLWLHGSLPLALALLIAGVGVGIATAAIGTARIAQLRRLSRRR
ncbi:hypothetical protein BG844_28145 [Couchioplanes caeruleus subsp. caeruleus]|uniref:Uncharacterized protein n=3 Tax=Couchioplanes caeruleus TaxID=56438 RepID=A0A1K0GJN9_9ACTN|nr:hypothetical protein BG844_28145 [Couchioplanes caeruleus subsp. caeruleus]